MKIGSVFVLASLVFLSAALEPVFEFRPADGKPYHAGDLPEDLPRLRFPEEKFSAGNVSIYRQQWIPRDRFQGEPGKNERGFFLSAL